MDNNLNQLNNEFHGEQNHILQLADHCLLEVFTQKSFTLLDLCSIAETCQRFQEVVQRASPRELCIRIRHTGDYDIKTRYALTSTNGPGIERIFKNFGPLLTGISIAIPRVAFSYEEYIKQNMEVVQRQQQKQYEGSNFVLHVVARFCVDSLKVLKICGLKVPRYITEELRPIFARLEVLKIRDAVVSDDDTLFAGCDALTELRVVHVDNCQAILANIFPKLELFGYGKPYKPSCTYWSDVSDSQKDVVVDRLSTFILLHLSLKKVILANKMDARFLRIFEDGFDKLEELGLNMSGINVASLHQLGALKSLKTLKLMHASCGDLTFVPAMAKLRELYSYDCRLPDDRSFQFYFLLQLTKLHIMHGETPVPDVVHIVQQMIHLRMLTIFDLEKFVLDKETFTKIVAIVDGRPQRLTIKCRFDFDAKKWNENQHVRLLHVERSPVHPNF
ncbi:uncharacterized protein LOC119077390 isoform X2 [Bradysia coprophila]|uniref:uncharacterized protein LOC119077390 isoform X2 n=1 Tax=Bradysia coprophila TaxID=38358 RepID=UPI00187DA0E4|nr:uncharacterized protein LOC119077390 isoform X2 [Bradysia coprophila]